MLSCIAMAVFGIARKRGIFFLIMLSISLIVAPVTTEIKIFLSVNSFLIPFITSFTWNGLTDKRITSLFLTAAALSLVTSIPFSLSDWRVAVFLFVMVMSEAFANL